MRAPQPIAVVVARGLMAVALLSGCARDPAPPTPSPASTTGAGDTIADGEDASAAAPSTLQELAKSPADGLYIVDAIIVNVEVCHCPPAAQCDCPPDALYVTNDLADSAAWSLRTYGVYDLEARFAKGSRWRLLVRAVHGEPRVVGAFRSKP